MAGRIVAFALKQRVLVLVFAVGMLVWGGYNLVFGDHDQFFFEFKVEASFSAS